MYLRYILNSVSGIVCNMGVLKQNLEETGGKLVPIHNTVTLQWVFFFCSGFFRLLSQSVCMHNWCSRSFFRTDAVDTHYPSHLTHNTKPMNWAWNW